MIHNSNKPVSELIEFVDSIVLYLYDDDKFKDPKREAKHYDFCPYHAPELHLPTWVK